MIDCRYVYEFRAIEKRISFGDDTLDGYAGDLHGGANPFDDPLPTPIGRIEGCLADVHGRMNKMEMRMQQLGAQEVTADARSQRTDGGASDGRGAVNWTSVLEMVFGDEQGDARGDAPEAKDSFTRQDALGAATGELPSQTAA